MELKKQFISGLVLGLCLAACAGVSFPYKYYGIDLPDSKLLGPTAADDLAISECLPTPTNASPCVGMLQDAFLAMKQDYIETKNQLIACQEQLSSK